MSALSSDDADPSLLVCVLDVDVASWNSRLGSTLENQVTYDEVVSSLIVFCNTYVLMHRANKLAVLVSRQGECKQVYPRRILQDTTPSEANQNQTTSEGASDDFVPVGHLLPSILASGLLDPSLISGFSNAAAVNSVGGKPRSYISSAMSKALCIINKQKLLTPKVQPRILVVQLGNDDAKSYNNMMNGIFSADKFNAPVDAVVLGEKDSHFLQQACYLTRGTYQKPRDQRDLLQLLLTHCLPSSYMRSKLHAPVQRTVDFRASCVCHKKPVAFAYMCSVCLALFCEPGTKCLVCEIPAR